MQPILERIASPKDLKSLSAEERKQLAVEIRRQIISVMAVNGGHLSSNLGSVELTVALHHVFEAPRDKLIWDTSHQTYTHKLITGRKERFHTIRQHQGLCGFAHPEESPYDHFYAGHAGTALSLALGVATARDIRKDSEYVIPIIGDADLTCGLTHEALNNIGSQLRRFVVVLNDNAMAISKNVGAVTSILSRLLNNPTSSKILTQLKKLVSKIPTYGARIARQGHKLKVSLQNIVSPAAFFAHFGLTYIGPVDGHDTEKLISVLEAIKEADLGPVLLHVITKKGHGMAEATQDPICYHGVRPFDPGTGKFLPLKSDQPTFPKLVGNYLLEKAQQDPSIVCLTPAMSKGSCLDEMMQQFPNRCIDVGIAEGHCVTFAGGLSYQSGLKVFSCIYATFLSRAFDNVFHDVCLQKQPVIFLIDRAGLSGPDGPTHHGIYDIGFLQSMPNMIICQPRNGQLLVELMHAAPAWKQPTAIRYPNAQTESAKLPLQKRALGEGELLVQGSRLCLIALGTLCHLAFKVRELLKAYGIEASIVDPIFVKPLDSALLLQLSETHTQFVTLEEHALNCGLGSAINQFVMQNGLNTVQTVNIGIPEAFPQFGSNADLYKEFGLTPEAIVAKIVEQFALRTEPAETFSGIGSEIQTVAV